MTQERINRRCLVRLNRSRSELVLRSGPVERVEPFVATAGVPANAVTYNGAPVTYQGQYVTYQ